MYSCVTVSFSSRLPSSGKAEVSDVPFVSTNTENSAEGNLSSFLISEVPGFSGIFVSQDFISCFLPNLLLTQFLKCENRESRKSFFCSTSACIFASSIAYFSASITN